jgi:hypothetical protein
MHSARLPLEEFWQQLLGLRATGYRFPDYVLEWIAEEIKERDGGQ